MEIKIQAFKFHQLNNDAKSRVINWLDELPIECEDEDEQGNIINTIEYFSDMQEGEIEEHCEMNEYLFSKYGDCVHHLQIDKAALARRLI